MNERMSASGISLRPANPAIPFHAASPAPFPIIHVLVVANVLSHLHLSSLIFHLVLRLKNPGQMKSIKNHNSHIISSNRSQMPRRFYVALILSRHFAYLMQLCATELFLSPDLFLGRETRGAGFLPAGEKMSVSRSWYKGRKNLKRKILCE